MTETNSDSRWNSLEAEFRAQRLPDAQHVQLPHVGHWPQLEDPEGFDGALLDFLARRRVLH